MVLYRWWSCVFCSVVLLLAVCILPARAEGPKSKLDTFEDDVAPKVEHTSPPADDDDDDRDDDDHHHDGQCERRDDDNSQSTTASSDGLGDILFGAIRDAGRASLYRVRSSLAAVNGITPRRSGEPLLPLCRLDTAIRTVPDSITATDLRAEVGYGPYAFHYSQSRYVEEDPLDALIISEYLGMYRMTFTEQLEVDMGYGQLTIDGNRFTRKDVLTFPILYHDIRGWGVEFRPAWASNLRDFDLSANYSPRFGTVKVGYRWVLGNTTSLSGPYAGLALQF